MEDTRSYNGGGDEIRTLYVVGLPDDVRERELRNLFRFYPAYRGSMLSEKKGKYGGTLAFALFESKAAALEAKAVLDNTPFDQADPDGPKLSLHLAKKNINPRMLRESRLLTQQSQPVGTYSVGGYNHSNGVAGGGNGGGGGNYGPAYMSQQSQPWPPPAPPMRSSYHSPGPVGYGAPGGPSGVIGGAMANGTSFLGIDPYDNPVHPSQAWQDPDMGVQLSSPWAPPPPLDSPGPTFSAAPMRAGEPRRYRVNQNHFSSPIGSRQYPAPTDAFAQ